MNDCAFARRASGALLIAGSLALALLAGVRSGEAAEPSPPPAPCSLPPAELYDRVSPAVVSIAAMSINAYDVTDRTTRVLGSGVIIDPSGLVLTNSHVVFGRQAISVTLDDGGTAPARVVGADPLFDIALIRIPQPDKGELATAVLGDSDGLHVGDEVFAIGNPFGLDQTLSRGIVSAVNRILPDVALSVSEPMIQTDAPINPGSSGGPLIDHCGQVIGITTSILPEAQNIGFAIPVNVIKAAIPSLTENGRIVRPWFGVQGELVAPILKDLLRVPLVDGMLVEVVEPGSPAERAGVVGGRLDVSIEGDPFLLGGDIITEVDGVPVTDLERFGRLLHGLKPGMTLHMKLFRDGKTREVEVALTERPLLPEDLPERRSMAPAGVNSAKGFSPTHAPRLVF